jgi:hypothetical protein
VKESLWTEVVTIRLFGGTLARERYDYFSAPHPRMPFIPRKSLGAALLSLRGTLDEYRRSGMRTIAKKNLKLAIKHGYVYEQVDGLSVFDDLMAINASLPQRGGQLMDDLYFDRGRFGDIVREAGHIHVVKAADGKVVAYAMVPNIGEVWLIDYILGHGDHLKRGIMYLLVAKVIEEKFARKELPGAPAWIMYDTMFGAPEGRRQFKRVTGFSAYWVRWRWPESPIP